MNAEILDTRRLTGASLLLDRPGAILDVACSEGAGEDFAAAWREAARRIHEALGWREEELAVRSFPGGLGLAMTAPIDVLYAATEVNEWAFDAALARVKGESVPSIEDATERLRRLIEEEANPALLSLRAEAARRGVSFLTDPDHVSVGLGTGSRTFPVDGIPRPDAVDWSAVHDVPVALVTGTNGKSTTVRLLASIATAGGWTAGYSSTDGVMVGRSLVDGGDYSGPEGARRTLRDSRVEIAILETARGGLLRRGLAVERAAVALVTNVAEDHLGEWGIGDLDTLARTKLTVSRAVAFGGSLVLNGEDSTLLRLAADVTVPVQWFALDRTETASSWLDGGTLMLRGEPVAEVDEIPIALGGAARHNVANALAAALVAGEMGLSAKEIREGLHRFSGTPEENPGRGNLFDLGGVTALVDYAHNPHGCRALFSMTAALPATRKLLLLGQAGDRTDDAIDELVRVAYETRPDRVVVKEMESLLRGREKGEVPALIERELRRLGMQDDRIERAETELDAVHAALRWARPGDLLLLLVHSERPAVLALLSRLRREGWTPGDAI